MSSGAALRVVGFQPIHDPGVGNSGAGPGKRQSDSRLSESFTLKSDLVFDVSNRGEKLKTSDSGVQFTQQLDKGWTVGGKLNYKTDAAKGDKLDLSVNFGNDSKERKVNFEFGVADVTKRPDYFVKANLQILSW